MAYCPSCSAEIAADAADCPSCAATFGEGAKWKPLAQPPSETPEPPSRTERVVSGILKVIFVALSLAALGLGGLWAYHEKNPAASAAMVACGIAIVAIAVFTRLRWSLLAVVIAVPLGLTTCMANFKWHGG